MPDTNRKLTTVIQILEAALGKEKQAFDFYTRVLQRSGAEVIRDVISRLRDEELRHVRMVEEMIARLESGREPS